MARAARLRQPRAVGERHRLERERGVVGVIVATRAVRESASVAVSGARSRHRLSRRVRRDDRARAPRERGRQLARARLARADGPLAANDGHARRRPARARGERGRRGGLHGRNGYAVRPRTRRGARRTARTYACVLCAALRADRHRCAALDLVNRLNVRHRRAQASRRLLAQLRDEVVIVVAAVGIGEFDGALIGGVAHARDQQQRFVGRDAHLLRDFVARVHGAEMLERAHDRQSALFEKAVERVADRVRIGNQRGGKRGVFDGHDDAVRETQTLQTRDGGGGRQAELDHLVAARGLDLAREPARTGRETALAQHFAEAREARERIFVARRDEAARALRAADQPLLDQQRDGFARRDARDAERVGEHALGRQRLAGVPAILVDRVAELARELQIQRRVVVRVRAQAAPAVFRGSVHGRQA
ncbi:hypothetical protein PT2222_40441 [Paraburkholderia tropica]